jgi:hypothetical protein
MKLFPIEVSKHREELRPIRSLDILACSLESDNDKTIRRFIQYEAEAKIDSIPEKLRNKVIYYESKKVKVNNPSSENGVRYYIALQLYIKDKDKKDY